MIRAKPPVEKIKRAITSTRSFFSKLSLPEARAETGCDNALQFSRCREEIRAETSNSPSAPRFD
jgi:hypothetical protein